MAFDQIEHFLSPPLHIVAEAIEVSLVLFFLELLRKQQRGINSAMHRIGQFLVAIWSDWASRMSGPATVPLTVLAFYAGNDTYKRMWGALALVSALITVFRVWLFERTRYEKVVAARSMKAAWEAILFRFDEGSYPVSIYAGWERKPKDAEITKLNWWVGGCRDEIQQQKLISVMEEAGSMILNSEFARSRFPNMLLQKEPADRWLTTMLLINPPSKQITGTGIDKGVESESAMMDQLLRRCVVLCSQLAAKEAVIFEETAAVNPSGLLLR